MVSLPRVRVVALTATPGVGYLPLGSGQQSVTGVEASDDANSYWQIRGGSEGGCPRGSPVRCGQAVRLTHVLTGKNLHTHHFPSPLSNNQVSPWSICEGPGAGSEPRLPLWNGNFKSEVFVERPLWGHRGDCMRQGPVHWSSLPRQKEPSS